MKLAIILSAIMFLSFSTLLPAVAGDRPVEISDDGRETVFIEGDQTEAPARANRSAMPYGASPDWENSIRRQVGGLQVADMNGDGRMDIVVGCYISNSYPPYEDWENLIYFNTGSEPEANPSWVSADEVSTGDIQVAFIDNDTFPDIFSANGGFSMDPSVVYRGGPSGPSVTPGWSSAEPGGAWNNYALPFDIDHDGDMDVITANQGNSPTDPYRPMFIFVNNAGVLPVYPTWQSAEWSIQNFLAAADYDQDGWEDIAVSKWVNFESGIYRNAAGSIETTPVWTTGDDDSDKGVAWANVDDNGWPDLALGHDPTQLWRNDGGTLSTEWTSGATYFGHSDIRFCDVDRDGDEDLAETHFSDGKVHIYLNNGGVLDSLPSWTYDSPTVGTAIAFGDINGDEWPDLVVGNSGEPCVKVFYADPATGVDAAPPAAPSVTLHPCRPNPFNPATAISFDMKSDRRVRVAIHDLSGGLVRLLADRNFSGGEHSLYWNGANESGRDLPSGVYFVLLESDGERQTRKLSLVR